MVATPLGSARGVERTRRLAGPAPLSCASTIAAQDSGPYNNNILVYNPITALDYLLFLFLYDQIQLHHPRHLLLKLYPN